MYCTAQDVRAMLKDDLINSIIGNDYIADPEDQQVKLLPLIEAAIEDAGAEIDGYIGRRYPVPLADPPKVIVKYSKDIAVYNLVSRSGVISQEREDNYRERYKFAIKFLTTVAAGTASLGMEAPAKQAAVSFQMQSPPRLFGRDNMKGM